MAAARKLRVTQVRSVVRTRPEHRGTIRALGLRGVSSSKEHSDSEALRGMLRKVSGLVRVEEVE
jgi:large subunit ribosomal protein L30